MRAGHACRPLVGRRVRRTSPTKPQARAAVQTDMRPDPHVRPLLPFEQWPPFNPIRPPSRMRIPGIGVDAAVEQVGFLAVPQDPKDVAWFQTGSAPGEPGTATFDGHLDWIGFKPAVFWDLAKVHAGDEIDIVGPDGQKQAWTVDLTASVPYTSIPPDWLYARDGPPRISLITCDGAWSGQIYTNRLLVRAVPAGSA